MYTVIQLHPLMASEKKSLNTFKEGLAFLLNGNQSTSVIKTKFKWLVEDYSINISVKRLSKFIV